MGFNRATKGNVSGIAEVIKASDKNVKRLYILPESLANRIREKAFKDGVSQSEIVRRALEVYKDI